MENSLVIFGSYEKGPEYEEKRANVEKLVTQGLDAHLFYSSRDILQRNQKDHHISPE